MKNIAGRVQPHKQFGQHFLTDPNILQTIVGAAEISPDTTVLEIGPGQGHLTRALLQTGARVVAIEIDRNLAQQLRAETQNYPTLTILEGDFLTATPEEWLACAGLGTASYQVVANLPYYITSAILRQILEAKHAPTSIVVMVQREVAKQITAQPNKMNLLAVSVQFYGQPQIVKIVPAGAFYPRPQVDSAIVRIAVTPRWAEVNAARFFEIVRAGFGEKRKQLRNALAHGLNMDAAQIDLRLMRAHIDPQRRAETLSLAEWHKIYTQFGS